MNYMVSVTNIETNLTRGTYADTLTKTHGSKQEQLPWFTHLLCQQLSNYKNTDNYFVQ